MALTKIFAKKPYVSNEKTYVSEIIFSKQEINSTVLSREDCNKSYKIWSVELGIIDIPLKANQGVYNATLKILKKLQKDTVPSHLIISKTVKESDQVVTTYTIYRLTEEQELTMYFQDLMPSIDKREKGLQMKAEKEREQYLAYCKEFEKSLNG
ncbi:MAG: hypothetical protein WCN88_00770 [Candidatus Falkowbacteria bacterium]